jgi:phytoene dehydrogenase-like protein
MTHSVIIIGGGMAGLAAGCFARMSGFKAEIIEMHSIPGGVCTAWKRNGYTFDLCIHWLAGSKPGTEIYRLYESLGLVQDRTFIKTEYWVKVRDQKGNELTVYNNPDTLEQELLRISPEDKQFITGLCKDIRKISGVNLPVELSLLDKITFIPLLSTITRYKEPMEKILAGVKNPVLRNLLFAGLDWEGQSAIFPLIGLALQGAGNGGYPIGGSLPLAKSLEKRFQDLGGTIRYKSRVTSIIIREGQAAGVRLSDNTELYADAIISCADGHTTIFEMLNGEFCDDTIRGYYRNLQPFPPILFFSFGINADLAHLPHAEVLLLDKPVEIGGSEHTLLSFNNYAKDPTLYPPGKGVLTLWLPVRWEYWEQFPYQGDVYRQEKEKAAQDVIDLLVRHHPELSGAIEVIDVASPMTFARYTGNWRGSYEGWLVTPDAFFLELPNTLPGLSRFSMAGQWVIAGGGVSGAITSARKAVKVLCKEMNQPFRDHV